LLGANSPLLKLTKVTVLVIISD